MVTIGGIAVDDQDHPFKRRAGQIQLKRSTVGKTDGVRVGVLEKRFFVIDASSGRICA
jgi:hypothetical protein